MLPRRAPRTLQSMARGFPVLAITGPRQSGKTTLARTAFAGLPYVNLEDPDTREFATADPRRFLARHAGGAVFEHSDHFVMSWRELGGAAPTVTAGLKPPAA